MIVTKEYLLWDEWNANGGPKYPHEKVVQYTFRNFSENMRAGKKALDLGCGSGVHSIFLAAEGFDLYFSDISEVGVSNTLKSLKERQLPFLGHEVTSIESTSFVKSSFDLIICVGVLDSAGPLVSTAAIEKAWELLKKSGKGLFLFASDVDFRTKNMENRWSLHGYSEQEVTAMFEPHEWSNLAIDRYITTFENETYESNDFLVTVEK